MDPFPGHIRKKLRQYNKLLNRSITNIKRMRMHRVSGRHQGKKKKAYKNDIGHVDGLDITESCLLEREETSCVAAEEP